VDELSIVNINVSVLISSDENNSGSLTFNYSPDSSTKVGNRKNNSTNGSIANKSSKNSKYSNSKNYSNSNTSSSKGGVLKKPIYSNNNNTIGGSTEEKIRVTNIIVGANSNAFNNLNNVKSPDMMLRDIKALHLITQKALSTNAKQNPLDSIDDERRSFMNFNNINSKKALFVDESGGMYSHTNPNEMDNNSFNDSNKHIINIININNNYNIENINCSGNNNNNNFNNPNNSNKLNNNHSLRKSYNTINFYRKGMNSSKDDNSMSKDSAVSSKTNLKRMIPINNKSTSIKDIFKVYNNQQSTNQKFIKISK
jgi:hypothetical protein